MPKAKSSGSRRSSSSGPMRRSRKRRAPRHRRVLRGVTYLITKKCTGDLFFLLPSPIVNQILLYLLILKSLRYGLILHGFCFLSNHFHIVVTDPFGRLPDFMREFLSESSKAIQVATHGEHAIWSRKRYSAVALLDLDACERKLAYTVSNPVRDGLTLPGDWPGLTSATYEVGGVIEVQRPDVYFSDKRPATVRTTLQPLTETSGEELIEALDFDGDAAGTTSERATVSDRSTEEAEAVAAAAKQSAVESQRRVEALVEAAVQKCMERLRKEGKTLVGAEKVKAASRHRRGKRRVRHLNPRFATSDRELMREAMASYVRFERDHERAKKRYVRGETFVRFPTGTYGYRAQLGVQVMKQDSVA